jgi:hypothetical protein
VLDLTAGLHFLRRQLNGRESDTQRGFRNWDLQLYAGDSWRLRPSLTLNYGLRRAPVSRPYEVNGRNAIAYDADLNNLAPMLGFAWRLPRDLGVFRAAGSVQFGEIFPVTYQPVRFSPPGSVKFMVPAPQLLDPLGGAAQGGVPPDVKGNQHRLRLRHPPRPQPGRDRHALRDEGPQRVRSAARVPGPVHL